jgi:hypothetical protein
MAKNSVLAAPEVGDFVLCLGCASIVRLTSAGWTVPRPAELAEMPADQRRMLEYVQARFLEWCDRRDGVGPK